MNKTKIEWTNGTWNPIKGLCPVGCWYCYARKIYKRFGWDEQLRLANLIQSHDIDRLRKQGFQVDLIPPISNFPPERQKIFVCSTIEIFHPDIPNNWRDEIFDMIKSIPQHTFQILTKLPQNIDREMPDNVWLGTSITGENGDDWKSGVLEKIEAKVKFVSYEPMLDFPGYGFLRYGMMPFRGKLDWVILGRLTGYGHKYDPERYWIEAVVENAKEWDIPIFLKDNLKDIWGEPLMQEWPIDEGEGR